MKKEVKKLKAEVQDVLENNILNFWLNRMVDEENGGFYGRIDGNGVLHPDAEKGAILNARILWAFSASYRVMGKPEYLEAATRAKRYIIDHFIDQDFGGVYWSLDSKGCPLDTKKQFYAIGFAIYGLSEYVRATGDREALDYAIDLYDCIEEHALDKENNGYIEAMTRDWQPIADMRLSELDANYPKSQNTHLHIIEPYTNLLRCLKELKNAESCNYVPAIGSVMPINITVPQELMDCVEKSLRNLIDIFTDRILNPETHHLDLFFENDWTRGAGALESYGHDIECSWLMHEAALVLGDKKVLQKVDRWCMRQILTKGWWIVTCTGGFRRRTLWDGSISINILATKELWKKPSTAGNTSRTTSLIGMEVSGGGAVTRRDTSTTVTTRRGSGNVLITIPACALN